MRAVVQRVARAEVRIAGRVHAAIPRGVLVLLGVMQGDSEREACSLAEKIARLRIFPGQNKPLDRSLAEAGGAALVVSQFTLCGDLSRGNRPSFVRAAPPEAAERLYGHFCACLKDQGVPVSTGRFGAMMDVELVNEGPVTIVL